MTEQEVSMLSMKEEYFQWQHRGLRIAVFSLPILLIGMILSIQDHSVYFAGPDQWPLYLFGIGFFLFSLGLIALLSGYALYIYYIWKLGQIAKM